jgi:hypothetical protein
MSKTAQRKRQAYQDGYRYGLRNISTAAVRYPAAIIDAFRIGYKEGRRERYRVKKAMGFMGAVRSWVRRVFGVRNA